MRFLGAAYMHANYFVSLSFRSQRRSLHFRFARRLPSRVAQQVALPRVAAPHKGELAGHGAKDGTVALAGSSAKSST